MLHFPIRLAAAFRLPLLAFGVIGRRSAYVRIDAVGEAGAAGPELVARFGWFALRTPLANLERWQISGPYRWWRTIGVRGSWGKPEVTFGGSSHGGVALFFRQPLRRWWWYRPIAVLYVTLDDVGGLAAELTARGIRGEDVRGSAAGNVEGSADVDG